MPCFFFSCCKHSRTLSLGCDDDLNRSSKVIGIAPPPQPGPQPLRTSGKAQPAARPMISCPARDGGAPSRCGGTPVIAISEDPYSDFRRSMLEMVEAKCAAADAEEDEKLDWGFMEELLACYLELNDESVHGEILRAFNDLASSFRFMAR